MEAIELIDQQNINLISGFSSAYSYTVLKVIKQKKMTVFFDFDSPKIARNSSLPTNKIPKQ